MFKHFENSSVIRWILDDTDLNRVSGSSGVVVGGGVVVATTAVVVAGGVVVATSAVVVAGGVVVVVAITTDGGGAAVIWKGNSSGPNKLEQAMGRD
jgi:hypothetical protein